MTTELTPTRQEPFAYTATAMVKALETTWAGIRTHHPEIPAVVMVLGPARGKWGHFAAGRWQHADARLPEVLVAAEGLSRPADAVLTTLVHEAAHGLAHARGVVDTSRNGRYHNKRFRAVADELGLDSERVPRYGWSQCTLRGDTTHHYRAELAALTEAMTAYRHGDTTVTRRTAPGSITARCACPRMIRVTRSVFDTGPITCGVCREAFQQEAT